MDPRFETYVDRAGEDRWHLLGANGRILAQGESHRDDHDVERAIGDVVQAVQDALVQTENDDYVPRIVRLTPKRESVDPAPTEGEPGQGTDTI